MHACLSFCIVFFDVFSTIFGVLVVDYRRSEAKKGSLTNISNLFAFEIFNLVYCGLVSWRGDMHVTSVGPCRTHDADALHKDVHSLVSF